MSDVADWEELSRGYLPGLLGIEIVSADKGALRSRLVVKPEHLAPNGFLHAATVVALADTSCGYGCRISLPEGGTGFTTIELKANFMGTAREGSLACEAVMLHGGRTTQVWDATVAHEDSGKTISVFRCTQLILA